jgi:proteasome assembly chaperone (PAC2) family protein
MRCVARIQTRHRRKAKRTRGVFIKAGVGLGSSLSAEMLADEQDVRIVVELFSQQLGTSVVGCAGIGW